MENKYKLRYLSLFFEDASEIASYIRDTLTEGSTKVMEIRRLLYSRRDFNQFV